MALINGSMSNFQSEVLDAKKTVLVDFYATWCGPCRMIAPILEQIASERDDIKIVKVNVDEEGELAAQYGIMSIPTLLVFKNGEVTQRSMGAKPKGQILAMLEA